MRVRMAMILLTPAVSTGSALTEPQAVERTPVTYQRATSTATTQNLVIVTQILPPDPQAGMKSTHTIRIDFDNRSVSEAFTTGTTDFFGVSLASVRDRFRVSGVTFPSANEVHFEVSGETASGVRVLPNINYRFDVQARRDGRAQVTGCHDGYPAYTVTYRGSQAYHFPHQPINLLNLFGKCDVVVK